MLHCIYACGLRAGEATTLEIVAIAGVNRQLRIIGKGNKERIVPLPGPDLPSCPRSMALAALAMIRSHGSTAFLGASLPLIDDQRCNHVIQLPDVFVRLLLMYRHGDKDANKRSCRAEVIGIVVG